MSRVARTSLALVLALFASLLPVAAATAKSHRHGSKADRWARQHHLKGRWRKKDADNDGLTNAKEFAAKTDPRRADTDRDGLKDRAEVATHNDPRKRDTDGDGIKDGDEHAGTVASFDGTTVTIRLAKGGALTARLDPDLEVSCSGKGASSGADDGDDDASDDTADDTGDSSGDDEAGDPSDPSDTSDTSGDAGDDGDDGDDASAAAACAIRPGAVVRGADLDLVDGHVVLVAIDLV